MHSNITLLIASWRLKVSSKNKMTIITRLWQHGWIRWQSGHHHCKVCNLDCNFVSCLRGQLYIWFSLKSCIFCLCIWTWGCKIWEWVILWVLTYEESVVSRQFKNDKVLMFDCWNSFYLIWKDIPKLFNTHIVLCFITMILYHCIQWWFLM